MLQAAEGSHLIHQIAFTYRYLYGVQELKRRLQRGISANPIMCGCNMPPGMG